MIVKVNLLGNVVVKFSENNLYLYMHFDFLNNLAAENWIVQNRTEKCLNHLKNCKMLGREFLRLLTRIFNYIFLLCKIAKCDGHFLSMKMLQSNECKNIKHNTCSIVFSFANSKCLCMLNAIAKSFILNDSELLIVIFRYIEIINWVYFIIINT